MEETVSILWRSVVNVNHHAVRNVEARVGELRIVGVDSVVILPARVSNRRSTVVNRVRVSESVRSREVETECEALLQLSRELIRIAVVAVLGVDNRVEAVVNRIVRSSRCFYARNSVNLSRLSKGEVFEVHSVEGLRVQAFENHLPAVAELLFVCQVSTKHLWELHLLVESYDIRVSSSAAEFNEAVSVGCYVRNILGECATDLFHTAVVVSVRYPNEWDATGEQTNTTTEECLVVVSSVPTEAYARREHQLWRRSLTNLHAPALFS